MAVIIWVHLQNWLNCYHPQKCELRSLVLRRKSCCKKYYIKLVRKLSLGVHLIWLCQTRFVHYLFKRIYLNTINKSCGMQSKVLNKSVRTAPTIKLLSKFSFHSSTILISTCWVLYDFLYAAKKGEKKLFYIRNQKVFSKHFVNLWGV